MVTMHVSRGPGAVTLYGFDNERERSDYVKSRAKLPSLTFESSTAAHPIQWAKDLVDHIKAVRGDNAMVKLVRDGREQLI